VVEGPAVIEGEYTTIGRARGDAFFD